MGKIIDFMERAITPIAMKIGTNKYLLAIRDTFIGMLAIIMVGSFAVLINNLAGFEQFKWFETFMSGTFGLKWRALNDMIVFGTLSCMSIFIVFGLSNRLAKNLGEDGFEAMLVAGASYFTLLPQFRELKFTPEGSKEAIKHVTYGMVSWSGNFDETALFFAMIVTILSTVIFIWLSKVKFLTIKVHEDVSTVLSRSFAKLLPGILTVVLIALCGLIFGLIMSPDGTYTTFTMNNSVKQQFMNWIQPTIGKVDSLGMIIFIVFLTQLFWCVGLPGNYMVFGSVAKLMIDLANKNAGLYAKGIAVSSGQYNVVAGPFLDAFVYLGGPGTTLGLLIAMFVFAKKKRTLVGFGLPLGVFQINEPVLFGIPIILNPVYFIPFILAPVILAAISYLAISCGIVHPVVAVSMPWFTPVGLGGYLATGKHISGAVLAMVNLLITIFIYAPFVKVAEKIENKKIEQVYNVIEI